MAAQEEKSGHLSAARDLLAELEGTQDDQAKATAAAAHATLVLAEQVAVVRVIMAGEVARERMTAG
jgi:hypothetical protein